MGGNLGLNDAGVESVMHQNNLDGLRRHGARVRDAYANGNLNYDAFMSCYQENIMAFDERFKDAELPWSLADRALTFPKLYFSFAPMQFHIIVVLVGIVVYWSMMRKPATATRGEQMCNLAVSTQKF